MAKVFTIAGMHRSGTSLVAKWFHDSGVFMGYNLLDSASSNPKGHFEDVELLELHKKQLRENGLHESGLVLSNLRWSFSEENLIQAQKIIATRNHFNAWGWKEPRSTLYLVQWKELVPELKVISLFRNPILVVQSLYKRLRKNKWYYTRNPITRLKWYFDIDRSPGKWEGIFFKTYEEYNSQILDFHARFPEDSMIICIDELIENSEYFKNEINKFLDLETGLVQFSEVFDERIITRRTEGSILATHGAMSTFELLMDAKQP